MKRLLAIAALLLGLGGAAVSHAEQAAISSDDAIAIHEVVQAQLEAFANDDAAAAFDLATEEKRLLIGSADRFLHMIREHYEPIYKPLAVIYFKPEVIHGVAVQMVRVTDATSRVWVALFWMQQDGDSVWKIDGCHLLETTSVSV